MLQIALFDNVNLNILIELKEAMNAAARQSGLSRDQILDKMIDMAAANGIHLTATNKVFVEDVKHTENNQYHAESGTDF